MESEDELIAMVRETPMRPGGPVMAEVAAEEVENWAGAGWRIASEPDADDRDGQPEGTEGDGEPGEDAGAEPQENSSEAKQHPDEQGEEHGTGGGQKGLPPKGKKKPSEKKP